MAIATLESIISTTQVSFRHTEKLSKAIEKMRELSISSVVVVDDKYQPVGIVTEHDFLRFISKNMHQDILLQEVMTPEPFCMPGSTNLHDAYINMEGRQFRHVIAVDTQNKFLGVVTEGDFLRHIGIEELDKFKSVANVMKKIPLVVSEDISITKLAEMMKRFKTDFALLMRNNRPFGIVSERDVIYCCIDHSSVEEVKITDLVRQDFSVVHKDLYLHEAASIMAKHNVHQLLIMDDEGDFIGSLTRHDLLLAVHGSYFEFLLKLLEEKNSIIDELESKKIQLGIEKIRNEEKAKELDQIQSLSHIGTWEWDMKQDRFTGSKEAFRIFELDDDQGIITYKDVIDFFLPHEQTKIAYQLLEAPKIEKNIGSIYEIQTKKGTQKWIKTSTEFIYDQDEQPLRAIGIIQDFTDRVRYEQQLETLANYDSLTGLANRMFLLTHLEYVIKTAKRTGEQFAVLMFDLDRFKDINDSYGHTSGDELLVQVANRFLARLREGDLISRLGGDEFAVVMPNLVQAEDAGRLAEEMIKALAQDYKLSNGVSVHVGTSVGIVLYPHHAKDPTTLLQYGDAALYKSKEEGRGIYRYYTDELTSKARKRLECESQLHKALANNEFEVYYQPQVHIASGRIVGAEALMRWNHPQRGVISPTEFIPMAEETGLINEMGEWILHETCRQGKEWMNRGHRLTLAVNLSVHQIRSMNIPQKVEDILKRTGYDPQKLELELTESALMQREEESVEMLHTLRAKGIRLAIDDFGTGYSSLSYLKRFPIDVLKIDKSFIDDVPYEKDDMAIVTAIIAMGQALNFQVLAEGVEHQEQLEFLHEKGCSLFQGYLKSKPLCAKEFEILLAE